MALTYYISKDADTIADFRSKVVHRHFLRKEALIRAQLSEEVGVPIDDHIWGQILKALKTPAPRHPAEDSYYDKMITLSFRRKWHFELQLETNPMDFDMFSSLMPLAARLHGAGDGADRLAAEVLDIIRMSRAEKLALSALQEEYQTYFREKMEAHGLKSISGGSPEALAAFFDDIKGGWVKGKGRKSSVVVSNDRHRIQSLINWGAVDPFAISVRDTHGKEHRIVTHGNRIRPNLMRQMLADIPVDIADLVAVKPESARGAWYDIDNSNKKSSVAAFDENSFERDLYKRVSKHIKYASTDVIAEPIQVFMDALTGTEDHAQGY